MIEEDHIIARFSDPELLLWHAKFGTERLNVFQRGRLARLLEDHARELAPPRRMSPYEWAMAHAPKPPMPLAKAAGGRVA